MDILVNEKEVSFLAGLHHRDHHLCMSQYRFQSHIAIFLYLLGMVVNSICFGFAIWLFLKHSLSLGTLILSFTLIHRVFETLKEVVEYIPDLVKAAVSASRLGR